jgi:hypothetical protein
MLYDLSPQEVGPDRYTGLFLTAQFPASLPSKKTKNPALSGRTSPHAKKGLIPCSPEFVAKELRVWLGKRNGQEELGRMCGGSSPPYWTETVPWASRLALACVLASCRAGYGFRILASKLKADRKRKSEFEYSRRVREKRKWSTIRRSLLGEVSF